jgi:hypothetical protein
VRLKNEFGIFQFAKSNDWDMFGNGSIKIEFENQIFLMREGVGLFEKYFSFLINSFY